MPVKGLAFSALLHINETHSKTKDQKKSEIGMCPTERETGISWHLGHKWVNFLANLSLE